MMFTENDSSRPNDYRPTTQSNLGRGQSAGPFGQSMHVARPCLQTNGTPRRMRHWPCRLQGRSFSQIQGACAEVSTNAPQRLWRLSFRLGSRVVLGECSAAGLKVRWGCLRLGPPHAAVAFYPSAAEPNRASDGFSSPRAGCLPAGSPQPEVTRAHAPTCGAACGQGAGGGPVAAPVQPLGM